MRSVRRCATLVLLTSVVALAGCTASYAERIRDPDRHYALLHRTHDGRTISILAVADDPAEFAPFESDVLVREAADGATTWWSRLPGAWHVEDLTWADASDCLQSMHRVPYPARWPGMVSHMVWREHDVSFDVLDLDLDSP